MRRADESREVVEDVRSTGDAVWIVPPTEHVPSPPRVSFGSLFSAARQIAVAKEALKSFGSPEPTEARKQAVKHARRVLRELENEASV